ncbi:MAG TPA: class II aldolase/adducin family protein [Mycobacteriales bacterium]|nr:class II aldolase/adducin family protein [Mycobacteriales bacterium]
MSSVHEQVLAGAKEMLRSGLTAGTSGNVSGRLADDTIVITPSSLSYEQMTLDDLVVLDLDGNVVGGHRSASSEKGVHLACYREFDEVSSVIHTHPLYATMFACARIPIPAAVDEFALYVGGDVPVCDYAMSGTDQLGVNAVAKLADVGSALLASHGMVTVGPSVERALHQAGVVERAAQVVMGARALGGVVPLPPRVNRDFAGVYKLMFRAPQE